MKAILTLAAVLAATTAPAVAIELDHNGSVMTARMSGHRVVIEYETPRPGLADAGVRSGEMLFLGTIRNGKVEGYATAFKKGCPGANYAVTGTAEGGRIELFGPGPVRKGCTWTLSEKSPHSRLVFTGVPEEIAAMDIEAGRTRTGAEMATILRPAAATPLRTVMAVETPAPVVATVPRNDPPPVADDEPAMTEDQIEEATIERELYPVPDVAPQPAATPAPVAPTVARNDAPPPAPPAAAPAPEPAKPALDIDF